MSGVMGAMAQNVRMPNLGIKKRLTGRVGGKKRSAKKTKKPANLEKEVSPVLLNKLLSLSDFLLLKNVCKNVLEKLAKTR